MTKQEFIEKAIQNGVQNDAYDVWVVVDGYQYTTSIDDVLNHAETYPFEASDYLESNLDAPAWDALYGCLIYRGLYDDLIYGI